MKSVEPESLPSLKVLMEQARSPNAGRAEVDALLLGLSQPPRPGEEAHKRAELLRLMLNDKRLRSFTGSQGRRVHAVAAQAMVALGEPYARELSPAALGAMRAAETLAAQSHAEPTEPADSQHEAQEPLAEGLALRQSFGLVLVMGIGAAELYLFVRYLTQSWTHPAVAGLLMYFLGITFLPARLATSRKAVAHRWLHFSCLGMVLLPCVPLLGMIYVFFLFSGYRYTEGDYTWPLIALALAFARVVAVRCLYTRRKD